MFHNRPRCCCFLGPATKKTNNHDESPKICCNSPYRLTTLLERNICQEYYFCAKTKVPIDDTLPFIGMTGQCAEGPRRLGLDLERHHVDYDHDLDIARCFDSLVRAGRLRSAAPERATPRLRRSHPNFQVADLCANFPRLNRAGIELHWCRNTRVRTLRHLLSFFFVSAGARRARGVPYDQAVQCLLDESLWFENRLPRCPFWSGLGVGRFIDRRPQANDGDPRILNGQG